MQGPQPQPMAQPQLNVVNDPEIGKVYSVYLKYPPNLNQDPPAISHNVRSTSRHYGILVHFDPVTRFGAIFLSVGQEQLQQPHMFLAWHGTMRLLHQPLHPLVPSPPEAFKEFPGFLNFSHLIRVKILQEGDLDVGALFPEVSEVIATWNFLLNTYMPPLSMDYLKNLHEAYWFGRRYSDRGEVIPLRKFGPRNGESDPFYPDIGLHYSTLMKMAFEHAIACDAQTKLAEGELEGELEGKLEGELGEDGRFWDDGKFCIAALLSPAHPILSDPFPFELVD